MRAILFYSLLIFCFILSSGKYYENEMYSLNDIIKNNEEKMRENNIIFSKKVSKIETSYKLKGKNHKKDFAGDIELKLKIQHPNKENANKRLILEKIDNQITSLGNKMGYRNIDYNIVKMQDKGGYIINGIKIRYLVLNAKVKMQNRG